MPKFVGVCIPMWVNWVLRFPPTSTGNLVLSLNVNVFRSVGLMKKLTVTVSGTYQTK